MRTCGIHLISTTYGTWLPGDDRGHWSPLFDLYGHLRQSGRQLNIPDHETRRQALNELTEAPKVLSPHEIELIATTLGHLLSQRQPGNYPPPTICAAAIEATHFHLLTGVMREDVASFIGRIKGTTASAILNLPGNANRSHVWTAHYWNVFLPDDDAFAAVQNYIEEHNARRGLPRAPYPWIHPRRITRNMR